MRKIFLLLVLLWCIVPACASQIPREITDAIPDSARPFLEDTDEADNFTSWNSGLSTLWTRTCKLLASTVQESLGGVILVMSAVLLCSVAEDCFHAATAAGGGAVSASVRQVATVFFSDLLMSLIHGLLFPMVWVFVALSAADAILPAGRLGGIARGLQKAVTWLLSGGLLLFTGYLSLSGAFATSADGLALRMARSAIGTAIPVVGGIISDAADTILAGAGVLRQSVGVVGTLTVLAICVLPFLKLGIQYLLLKLAAFFAATVAPEPLVRLVSSLSTAFGLVLGMTGAAALLLLISVASSVMMVSV